MPYLAYKDLAKRDAEAAKRFFRKALGQPHTLNPRTITVDKNLAYLCAIEQLVGTASCSASPGCGNASFSITLPNKSTGA